MGDVTNVKTGPCSVSFDGTDIGHTDGGAEVNYKPEYTDITVDLYGDTVVDKRLKGEGFSVTTRFAEATLANIKKAIPSGTLSGSKITIGKQAGYRLSEEAGLMILHPVENASNNKDEDITIYKAVIINEVKIPYNNEDKRVVEVEIFALLDETRANGNYLAAIGDTTS